MIKTGNSLRSVGLTRIAIDKPTRASLKALAEAEGLPLSHYLRVIVERESKNKSIPMALGQIGSGLSNVTELKGELHGISACLLALLQGYARFGNALFGEDRHILRSSVKEALLALNCKQSEVDAMLTSESAGERLIT